MLPLRPGSTLTCMWAQATEYCLQGLWLLETPHEVLSFAVSRYVGMQGLPPTTDVRGVVADVETMLRGNQPTGCSWQQPARSLTIPG